MYKAISGSRSTTSRNANSRFALTSLHTCSIFSTTSRLELFGITLFDMALSVALPLASLETENFNSFSSFGHIIDIAGLSQSQSSPSPSVSSDSSGIGSLGSLKSESVNSDSLPSSPQTTEKKLFEPVVQPQPRPIEKKPEDVKITYGGRDILNLMGNLTDPRWSYRPTVLPPNNPALFFANRSQYHRLGPYGTRTQYVKDSCRLCGFTWVVAATD
ncbi:hypothetical protein PYW08_001197 [Mythimna loreyi]|uniref:Uncharacterized protein n=1 Tax=Mythimna loreyi TaxID=667449 RepID=A0ACC2R0A8_9NEOP|nr:hypothetical protein PYW08_001197 [Mythimna loreyi]